MNAPTDPLESLNAAIIACRKCPRLVAWREEVARVRKRAYIDQEYWGKPVPGFGDRQARIFIVGLAPGAHGSNRTGRMFTGDSSGDFLYASLYREGLANQPFALHLNDTLTLRDVYIGAVCRCVPPDNKPLPSELANCRPFMEREIDLFRPTLEGFVALGGIAANWLTRWYREQGALKTQIKFAHGQFFRPAENLPWLITSYHPSRQNTQTGRLTADMFDAIWAQAKANLRP